MSTTTTTATTATKPNTNCNCPTASSSAAAVATKDKTVTSTSTTTHKDANTITTTTVTKGPPPPLPTTVQKHLSAMTVHDLQLFLRKHGKPSDDITDRNVLESRVRPLLQYNKMKMMMRSVHTEGSNVKKDVAIQKVVEETPTGTTTTVNVTKPLNVNASESLEERRVRSSYNYSMYKLHLIQTEIESSNILSASRVIALEDAIADVAAYKTADHWLGTKANKYLTPKQISDLDEKFNQVDAMFKEKAKLTPPMDANEVKAQIAAANAACGCSNKSAAGSADALCCSTVTLRPWVVNNVSAALLPTYYQLLDIHQRLMRLMTLNGALNAEQITEHDWLKFQLNHIESSEKKDGVWCGNLVQGLIPAGQAAITDKLEACHRASHKIDCDWEKNVTRTKAHDAARASKQLNELRLVALSLRPLYTELSQMHDELCDMKAKAHIKGNHPMTSEQAKNFNWDRVREIRHHLLSLERIWKFNGEVWLAPDSVGACFSLSDPIKHCPYPDDRSKEVHSTPQMPTYIPRGQAIIYRLVDQIHDAVDALIATDECKVLLGEDYDYPIVTHAASATSASCPTCSSSHGVREQCVDKITDLFGSGREGKVASGSKCDCSKSGSEHKCAGKACCNKNAGEERKQDSDQIHVNESDISDNPPPPQPNYQSLYFFKV